MDYQTLITIGKLSVILSAPVLLPLLWNYFNPIIKESIPKTDLRIAMDNIRIKEMQKKLKLKRNIRLVN